MRSVALATRDQHIDRELGSLSDRLTALSAVQAPAVLQPTQQMVRYEPQGQICEYKQTMVPLRDQGAFNSRMDYLQEGGIIRASRDGAGLQEPGWGRRPAVRQIPIQGSRPQAMPRIGGADLEQFPGGEYYVEGVQTAGASNSTGLAA